MNYKKIAVYGSRRQHGNVDEIRHLILGLVLDGAQLCMHEKLYDHLCGELSIDLNGVRKVYECPADADMALSIGGDGTYLRTVGWINGASMPVLGINAGHLGFLTAISLHEACDMLNLNEDLYDTFRVEPLTMLQPRADGLAHCPAALNEVVIAKEDSASIITARVNLNGTLLADYKADGLIISTPTGSTAYNLSVGGPIVEPSAPVWVISPIAAHSLTLRPLVINNDTEVAVKVEGRGRSFRMVIDGKSFSLPMGSEVVIGKAAATVNMLQLKDRPFTKIICSKLSFNG